MKSFVKIICLFFAIIRASHGEVNLDINFDNVLLNTNPFPQKTLKLPAIAQVYRADILKELTECDQNKNSKSNVLNNLSTSVLNITKAGTCNPNTLGLYSFSKQVCDNSVDCRKNFSLTHGSRHEELMNEIVAKDYANNLLKKNMESMDRLEIMKRFAKLKYNVNGETCRGPYQAPKASGMCNLNLLDEVFVTEQEKADNLAFKAYKSKNKIPNPAYVVNYNQYRLDQQFKKLESEDKIFINNLSDFVTSDEFKSLSLDKKAEAFLKKIQSNAGDKYYSDPILGFDFGPISKIEELKKIPKYQDLLSTFSASNLTPESFKESFDNLRKKRAESLLSSSATCTENVDLNNICEEMTTLSKGQKLFKTEGIANEFSTRNLSSEKDFERVKNLVGNDLSPSEYDILINAKRCLSFGLASEYMSTDFRFLLTPSWGERASRPYSSVAIHESSDVGASSKSLSNISGKKEKMSENNVGDPKNAEDVSKESSQESLANEKNTPPIENAPNVATNFNNQSFSPGSFDVENPAKDQVASEQTREEPIVATNPAVAVTPLDNKMLDLTKRLALAEENLEKMKASAEEAKEEENKRAMEKKNEELNAIIKDLKGQIAEVKAAKESSQAPQRAAAPSSSISEEQRFRSHNYSSPSSNNIVSAAIRSEVPSKIVTDNNDSNSSSPSRFVANLPNSRAGSSALLTSTTTSDGNKVLASGIVLTPVDGMSSEKMMQTISSRIIKLNGTPFYIEEGGMVKEIIAVIKDGKVLLDENGNPIFEKIVKGRVADSKFSRGNNQNRAPASITNVADLKRDQEEKLKKERAEYLKLKNLTNRIIRNK